MFQEAISRYLQSSGYSRIQLKSVLFDMDGVLFNSMPYHADAWHKVMERHGLHLSREEAYLHEGRTGAATINIVYQRQYGKDATPEMIQSIYAEKSAEFNSNPEPERAAAGIFTVAVNTGPIDGQVLLDAGANVLFPSMQDFCDNWENLRKAFE